MLAGTRARRSAAAERIRAASERADLRHLELILRERRLLPLIGSRLADAYPAVDPAFRDRADRALGRARARALALDAAAAHLLRVLSAEGIRAVPLKGTALAADAHGDLGMRESADIDLLVDVNDLPRAVELLRARSYEPPRDAVRANGLPDLHWSLPHPELPPVELHWRVHWYERDFSRGLLSRVRERNGRLAPEPTDYAAALLLCFARDGLLDVRLAADVAAWWDRHGPELAPAALDEHAARHPELRRPLQAAAGQLERLAGVPAAAWLSRPAGDRRVALAARVADWTQAADRDQLSANISLVDGLLAPSGGLPAFARRQLFTVRHGSRTVHATKTAARFVLAWLRARRGPWTPLPPLPG